VALVALPVIVSPAEEPPPPAEGSLTVELVGDEGWPRPALVALKAPGPSPKQATELRDSSGLHRGQAKPVEASRCQGEGSRSAFAKPDTDWCLELSKIPAGHELSGKVAGEKATLALTVKRRNNFIGWPLFALVVGGLTGLLGLYVPAALRNRVKSLQLEDLIDENDRAGARHIAGLREWIRRRQGDGAGDAVILATAHGLVRNGPQQVAAARRGLHEALEQSSLPPGHDYRNAAEHEARRSDLSLDDFLDGDDKVLEATPAEHFRRGLVKLQAAAREIEFERQRIQQLLKPECRELPAAALEAAQLRFGAIDQPGEVGELEAKLGTVKDATEEALAKDECRVSVRRGAEAAESESGQPVAFEAVTDQKLSLSGPAARTFKLSVLGALTAVCVILVLAFAYLTVKHATYDDKPTLAGFRDHFAIFSAALASGAAAAAVALLAIWDPAEQGDA